MPFSDRFQQNQFSQRFQQAPPSNFAIFNDRFLSQEAAQASPKEGILGGVIRDFVGTGRTIGGAGGSLVNLLGGNVAFTFDDVTKRDRTGALFTAALAAGGLLGSAFRGVKALRPLLGGTSSASRAAIAETATLAEALELSTLSGRAGFTAVGELVAGAAFGSIRGLEEDESRLNAIVKEGAFGATFGIGASLTKTAITRTIGGKVAELKKQKSAGMLRLVFEKQQRSIDEQLRFGIGFANKETGELALIQQTKAGGFRTTLFGEAGITASNSTETAGALAAELRSKGFEQGSLTAVEMLNKTRKAKVITKEGLATLQETAFDGSSIGSIDVNEFRAVREAASANFDADRELDVLATDLLSTSNEVGVTQFVSPEIGQQLRDVILDLTPAQKRAASDATLLAQGIREGHISLEGAVSATNADTFARELLLNEAVLDIDTIVVNSATDLVLRSFQLPRTIAAKFPAFEPLFNSNLARSTVLHEKRKSAEALLQGVKKDFTRDEVTKSVEIFDAVNEIMTGADSAFAELPLEEVMKISKQQLAKLAADADALAGSNRISSLVNILDEHLSDVLVRAQEAGILGEGIPGFFPMVNGMIGDWKITVDGKRFAGFHDTKELALAEAKRMLKENPNLKVAVAPNRVVLDDTTFANRNLADIKKFTESIRNSGAVGVEELLDDIEQTAAQAVFGANRPSTIKPRSANKRKLGLREFSKDPLVALDLYLSNTERAIAYGNFESEAAQILSAIPDATPELGRFANDFVKRALGRPSDVELQFQAVADWMTRAFGIGQGGARPAALRRYSSLIRGYETVARLGNPFSGVINSTQILFNTVPVLGPRWAAEGFKAVATPGRFKAAHAKFRGTEVEEVLGDMVLTDADGLSAELMRNLRRLGGKQGKLSAGVDTIKSMMLFAFNGAEKVNRLVTAEGAYRKAVAEGRAATAFSEAAEVVRRTQFSFLGDLGNKPQILDGPVGGTLFQFKSFLFAEIDFVMGLNKRQQTAFMTIMGSLGGVSALAAIPGLDLIDRSTQLFFDEQFNKASVSERLEIGASESKLKSFAAFGLPGLVNIDISDHVGIGNFADLVSGAVGPGVKDIQALIEFVKNGAAESVNNGAVSETTRSDFINQVAPTVFRRALRAHDVFTTGDFRNRRTGKLIYRPEDRYKAAALTAIGSPLVESSSNSTADFVAARSAERYRDLRRDFLKSITRLTREGSVQEARAVQVQAETKGIRITQSDIETAFRDAQRPAEPRRIRRTPKQIREELIPVYNVTGSFEPLR